MGQQGKRNSNDDIAQQRVDEANKIQDVLVYFKPFKVYERGDYKFDISCSFGSSLDELQKQQCFDLFENNMKDFYIDSGWGYNAKEKKLELFHQDSRYLIVTKDNEFCAFVHFRFVVDAECEVLYVYEIQVDLQYQRFGIGKRLMQIIELVARKTLMKYVVLTALKLNTNAINFYTNKLNFSIDETSPSQCGMNEPYEILSKCVETLRHK